MDLRALRSLVAIVDAGGTVKAAAALGLTQPALSKSVAKLEKDLGVRLLERGRKGVRPRPTRAGEVVIASLSVVLDEEHRMLEALANLRQCAPEGRPAPRAKAKSLAFAERPPTWDSLGPIAGEETAPDPGVPTTGS